MLSTRRTLALCKLGGRAAINREEEENSRGEKNMVEFEEGKEDSKKRKSFDMSLKCLRVGNYPHFPYSFLY